MTEYHPIITNTAIIIDLQKPIFCIDCGKQLKKRTAIYCKSCVQKGERGNHYGIPTIHSSKTRKKIALSKLGNKNPAWKGNKVGYFALHSWIKYRLKKSLLCENCHKEKPYDLANKSGEYKRDLSDWWYLCRNCHMVIDGRKEKYSFKKGIFYGNKYLSK